MNTESISDFFGRTTGKYFTLNLGEDEQPNFGTEYTYTYIWDGDVLLGGRIETVDGDESITVRYLYDDSGELYAMDYNGKGYFAFIKNLQGDIVSIVPLDPESNVELNNGYGSDYKASILNALKMRVIKGDIKSNGFNKKYLNDVYYKRIQVMIL